MSTLDEIKEKLLTDQYNTDLWGRLIVTSTSTGSPDVVRETYKNLLDKYPTSVQYWVEYLDFELSQNELSKVEALFTRCTVQVLALPVFNRYLRYIKQTNSIDSKPKGPRERVIISQAFEYTLMRVGFDAESGPIWQEYIAFLKTGEAHSSLEKQFTTDKIRKVYHQVISIPNLMLDALWREYERFELSLNPIMGKKSISEKAMLYTASRNALKELKVHWENIFQGPRVTAPPPSWTTQEIQMVDNWQSYLNWEKSNPLHIDADEVLNSRIIFAYNQALLSLRFYPEIWIDFAGFYLKIGKTEEAAKLYEQGSSALPSSVLLNCSYAEFEETQKRDKNAFSIYERVIKSLSDELKLVTSKFDLKLEQLTSSQKDTTLEQEGQEIDGEAKEALRRREKIKEKQRTEIEENKSTELNVIKRRITMVWMTYMKAARRCEGLKGLRRIFSEARKSGLVTYHLFVDSAMMEFYSQDDEKIPENIFHYGQKFFASEPGYISEYLSYLTQKKDANNARALFEKSLEAISKEKALPLWEKMTKFEACFGDITNIERTEKRIFESFPHVTPSRLIAERLNFLDIWATEELGYKNNSTRAKITPLSHTRPTDHSASSNSGKINSLESVTTDNFVRPDFKEWVSYQPSQEPAPTPAPAPTPSPLQTTHVPQPKNLTEVSNPAPIDLPEAVSYFLSQIPSAQEFTGPTIGADQILSLMEELAPRFQVTENLNQPGFINHAGYRPPHYNHIPPNFSEDNRSKRKFSPSIGATIRRNRPHS